MQYASRADMAEMLERYDTWIFDCDGTLWKGDQLIPRAKEALQLLRDAGKQVVFVTNNSSKSRASFKAKFDSLGLPAAAEEVFSSSFSAAAYLESVGFAKTGKKAYVVGGRGILEELEAAGIPAFGGPDDDGKTLSIASGEAIPIDRDVGAVVCGVDPGLSYYKVAFASVHLLTGGERGDCADVMFVACNTDARGHFISSQEWPGAGATVNAIKAVVEREPVVTGKPSTFLMDHVRRAHGVDPARAVMVGDRLDTDIEFGFACGMGTVLVMTGVVTEQSYSAAASAAAAASGGFRPPDYVMASFGDLACLADADGGGGGGSGADCAAAAAAAALSGEEMAAAADAVAAAAAAAEGASVLAAS